LVLDVLRKSRTRAALLIGVDSGDFEGGTAGTYHQLAIWDLEWDSIPSGGALEFIDGEEYDPADPDTFPELVLGSETDVATHMTTDPAAGRKFAQPTGLFVNGGPELHIKLYAEHLAAGSAPSVNAGILAPIAATARNGIGPNGADVPQLGPVDLEWSCDGEPVDNTSFCRIAYNTDTGRFELTADGLHQLDEECGRRRTCRDDEECVVTTCGAELTEPCLQPCLGSSDFLDCVEQECGALPSEIASCVGADGDLSLDDIVATPFDFVVPEWNQLFAHMQRKFGLTVRDFEVDEFPLADPIDDPLICPDPVFPTGFTVDRPVEIVLVLDRSLSMEAVVPKIEPRTRLDFVKAAARALAQVHASDVNPSRVGVVWFNHAAEIVEANATAGSMPFLVKNATEAGQITPEDLTSNLRDSTAGEDENPVPDGNTGIGEALAAAQGMFSQVAPGKLQSIVLLSDGEETAFPKGLSQIDPKVKAKQIADDPLTDIRIYTVPTGKDADRIEFAELAEDTSGTLLDADDPADLPQLFFEAAVRQKGQSLARHHASGYSSTNDQSLYTFDHPIDVETGAAELVILTSIREYVEGYWDSWVDLIDPAGITVPAEDVTVVNDPFFILVRYANPTAGRWNMRVTRYREEPNGLISAFVDNPGLACDASVDKRLAKRGEPVTIIGTAVDQLPIAEGMQLTVKVLRPDHSQIEIPLSYDRHNGDYRGTLPRSESRGRGLYQAVVRCDVGANARYHAGEDLVDNAPPNDLTSPRAFVREGSTHFYMDLDTDPPLPGPGSRFEGDADGDYIDDGSEPDVDTDGDGIPAVWDADDDGDEIIDGLDPDPQDPNLPFIGS
jgi:hypothetical protein